MIRRIAKVWNLWNQYGELHFLVCMRSGTPQGTANVDQVDGEWRKDQIWGRSLVH
jgi:hypothetical protein